MEIIRLNILKMHVCLTNMYAVLSQVDNWCAVNEGRYICVSNVHMCMETFDSEEYCKVISNADMVVPDGKPLVWAQKLLGYKEACQVRGQDLTMALCKMAIEKNLKVGFYGGTQEVLSVMKKKLSEQFVGLDIAYDFSPPFRALTFIENKEVINSINDSGVQILFVGIGCPKQERWMAEHKNKLNSVMIGVGAAFDFIAGNKKHAPRWMQSIGMEWLFRLLSEPNRLWKRYLKQNPRFLWYFTLQLLARKF